MSAVVELDPALEGLRSELEDTWTRLGEVGREAGRYAERLEWDPARFEEVQERLHRLGELLRRHGPTVEDVIAARRRLAAELEALAQGETRSAELGARRDELTAQAAKLGKHLSGRRRAVADALGKAVSAELGELGMGAARVVVEVTEAGSGASGLTVAGARLTRTGIDHVQFLIAPNRGLEPRPLRRIASGGELSRALLALKRVLSQSEQGAAGERAVGVQVFDEVDSGVGGETADRIGRAMASIAAQRQVLCITHLASIAAHADAHFAVAKHDGDDLVRATVERLEGEARVAELGRMLTGKSRGSTEKAAAELLAAARACREAPSAEGDWPRGGRRRPRGQRPRAPLPS
jgi:DNA repair protein RecN (Recombination protein N)